LREPSSQNRRHRSPLRIAARETENMRRDRRSELELLPGLKGESMQARRTSWIALTGVAWGVLAIVGIFTGPGETPEGDARPAKIFAFYSSHSSEVKVSAVLFSIAFLFLLLFAGTLRAFLRRDPGNEPLATLMLVAIGVVTAVAGIGGGIEVGLAKNIGHLGPQAAQAANLIENEVFLPIFVGGFVFGLCNGVAILRSRMLPAWLGWVAIVMAIVFLVPPAGFAGLLLLVLWSIAVSIVMFMRFDQTPGAPAPAAAVA
jgi:hypothetical protein